MYMEEGTFFNSLNFQQHCTLHNNIDIETAKYCVKRDIEVQQQHYSDILRVSSKL